MSERRGVLVRLRSISKGGLVTQRRRAGRALRRSLALLLSVCAPLCCHGQEQPGSSDQPALRASFLYRAGHYIRTHKLPLAAGAAVVLANSADAVSTLRAERYCPTCPDYSLGRDPSPAKVWFNTQLSSALVVPFNLLAYHHYGEEGPEPDKGGQKFFVALFSIPFVIHGIADTLDNTQIGPHNAANIAIARRRLLSTSSPLSEQFRPNTSHTERHIQLRCPERVDVHRCGCAIRER